MDSERIDYEANVMKDAIYEDLNGTTTYKTCAGCVFQRCFISNDIFGWRCRHPDSDGSIFHGDDSKTECRYGCKRY